MAAEGLPLHILVTDDTEEIRAEEGYRLTTSLSLLDFAKVKALALNNLV